MKRGQVGLFFIVGLVLIVVVGLLFIFFKTSFGFKESTPYSEVVESYVGQCIEDTFHDGIFELGGTGGYLEIPGTAKGDIPYYKIGDNILTPDLDDYENEISKYLNIILPICLDNFKIFENESFSVVEEGEVSSSVEIGKNLIGIDVKIPLEIKKGDKVYSLKDHVIKIKNKEIYQSYELAKIVVENSSVEGICITCFANYAEKNDFYVVVLPQEEDTFISIKSKEYKLFGREYELMFYLKK